MSIKRIFLVSLLISYISFAQWGGEKPNIKAFTGQYSEIDKISTFLHDLESTLRKGRIDAFLKNLSTDYSSKYMTKIKQITIPTGRKSRVIKHFVSIKNITVSVAGNTAEAVFFVTMGDSVKNIEEKMSLQFSDNAWKICKSTFLADFVLRHSLSIDTNNAEDQSQTELMKKAKPTESQNTSSSIDLDFVDVSLADMSINQSTAALIQIPLSSGGRYIVDREVTLTPPMSVKLFNSPAAGQFIKTRSGNLISLITDVKWNRLIVGGQNTSDDTYWLKSYGDHINEHRLSFASSVACDLDGNIFILTDYPRKVVQLKYTDDDSHGISFVREVILPNVQDPKDLCNDATINDIGVQNTIWVADKYGSAVHKIAADGSSSAKYTTVINPWGASVSFAQPEKILANFDQSYWPSLAVIDSDKKRILLITGITDMNNHTIYGYFKAINFLPETNAALCSIGSYELGSSAGLWVADTNNAVFHVFDLHYDGGYVGCVKATSNVHNLWAKPRFMMTPNLANESAGYRGPFIVDQWDDTHGITTYRSNPDLVNVVVSTIDDGQNSGCEITASIFNQCTIYGTIYNPSGNEVFPKQLMCTASASRGNIIYIQRSQVGADVIGKFKLHLSVSTDAPQACNFEQDISFAMPLRATLNGPETFTDADDGDTQLEWTAHLTSGSNDCSYKWYKRNSSSDNWIDVNCTMNNYLSYWAPNSFWLRCDITDNFTHLTQTITKFVSHVTTSGELASDEVWPSGSYTINGDVWVPSGKSLTIQPGANLNFLPGTSLYVAGVLNAYGTAAQVITLGGGTSTTKWGTITFESAESAHLDYAVINNGAGIQCLSGANVTVSNSSISNCANGIYISSANPSIHDNSIKNNPGNGIYGTGTASNYANIYNNSITKESGTPGYHTCLGIYLINGMSTYAGHNDISGFNQGMYFGGGSTAQLGTLNDDRPMPNNRIQNCLTAITSSWGGVCDAGQDDHTHADNSIFGNTRSLLAANSSYIYADFNYWGGSNNTPSMYCDAGSVIVFDDLVAESDPWLRPSSSKQDDAKTAVVLQKKEAPGKGSDIRVGLRLEQQGRIDEAVTLYKNMIKFDSFAEQAMSRIVSLNSRYNRGDGLDFLNPSKLKGNKHRTHIRKLLAGIQMKNGAYGQSAKLYDDIISDPSNDHEKYDAMFSKFFVLLHEANDADGAARILDALKKLPLKKVDDELVSRLDMAQTALDNSLGGKELMNRKAGKGVGVVIPAEYSLSDNFPNPFNPSTVIQYQLPLKNMVSLKIYDVLGREVKTLVNEMQDAGNYSVAFNGSSLVSGVYIYSLRSGSFSATKKMMVVK